MNNELYIVIPYFNFVNYKSGQVNLERCLNTLGKTPGVKLVLVEGYRDERLDDFSNQVYRHVKVHVPDVLWVKENLINIGFNHFPEDWRYGGWFDRDVLLLNPYWVEETKKVLETADVVQPWKQCIYLNSSFEYSPLVVREKEYPVAESLTGLHSSRQITAQNLYSGRHTQPGQAWAISRNYYEKLGGLYDKAILGGADSLWSIGLLGMKKFCVLEGIEEDSKEYLAKVSEAIVGSVDGALVHYYHGEIKNRQYVSRHSILKKHNYSPSEFLKYTEEGVLRYTAQGKVMEPDVLAYFIDRKED